MTTLWVKHQYAKCFGHWLVSDAECIRCAVAENCEKRTKVKGEEERHTIDNIENTGDAIKPLAPLEYMLQWLDGKFDHEIEDKNGAIIHKFKDNGDVVIAIVVGAYGKIKVISIKKNIQKMFGCLESIEEVEKVLAEML